MAMPNSQNEVTVRKLGEVVQGIWTKANEKFATASQGGKADTAIQGVKVNGTELEKDANNKVDVTVPIPTQNADNNPTMNGTAAKGSSAHYARTDHVHPTDTSREAVANKDTTTISDTTSTTKYPSNKAVADFVNSSISTSTANFLGTLDAVDDLGLTVTAESKPTNAQIATALASYSWPAGTTVTNNDYCFVSIDDPSVQPPVDVPEEFRKFKYTTGTNPASWLYEYSLNNSGFTAAQWAAINSGITSGDLTTLANKLDKTGDGKDVTVTFSAAETRTNISSTEKLSVIFGKITKWLGDLKALAFKDKVANSDISGTISDSHIASASTWNSKAAGDHTHAVTVNGVSKTIPATGGSAVELMTEMTAQEVTDILAELT